MNYITVLDTRDILIKDKFKNKMFNAEKLYAPEKFSTLMEWISVTNVSDVDIPILKSHNNWVLLLPDYREVLSKNKVKYPSDLVRQSTAYYSPLIRQWSDSNDIQVELIPFFVDEDAIENSVNCDWVKGCQQIETIIRQVYQDGDVVIDTCRNIFVTQAILQRGWECISASML